MNCQYIMAKTNQAILLTAEEKSVHRLGLYSVKETFLKENIMTKEDIQLLCDKFLEFEQGDTVSGFHNNLLVSGVKV